MSVKSTIAPSVYTACRVHTIACHAAKRRRRRHLIDAAAAAAGQNHPARRRRKNDVGAGL